MYIYIYIYVYTHIHIHIYICVIIYIYIYLFIYLFIYTCRAERDACEMCSELQIFARLHMRIKIHQRGVQWKQGVVVYIIL